VEEREWTADRFEENRAHLRAVAYRMLGSSTEAEDAVQEAWLRLSRTETGDVEDIRAWLTTVVARICLNMLRSRKALREDPLEGSASDEVASREGETDPEQEALLADSVGLALLVVLDTLTPAERLALVLHDTFGVSFEEIAPIVDRSPAAARQLASRARRRVRGAGQPPDADLARQREVVSAFLAAARNGDFEALLAILDPEVVVRADRAAAEIGASPEVRGARAVAETFAGRAQAARPALVDGAAGAVWAQGGTPRVVFDFTISEGRIVAIDLLSDPELLRELDLEISYGR
jgi:RNA polymerase sigma-70 factor (ECF subfamily)